MNDETSEGGREGGKRCKRYRKIRRKRRKRKIERKIDRKEREEGRGGGGQREKLEPCMTHFTYSHDKFDEDCAQNSMERN